MKRTSWREFSASVKEAMTQNESDFVTVSLSIIRGREKTVSIGLSVILQSDSENGPCYYLYFLKMLLR